MLIIVIPKSAGMFSQISIATRLMEIGYDICLWVTAPKSSLSNEVNIELESKSWKLVFKEDINSVKINEGVVSNNGFVEKVSNIFPGRKREAFKNLFHSYKSGMEKAMMLLGDLSPDLLIVSSDGIAADAFLSSAARHLDIPIVCCPYGFCGEIDLENDLRRKIKAGRSIDVAVVGGSTVEKLFSKWIKTIDGTDYLMLKPDVILAREAAGVSLIQPWRVYGSDADVMCVPSYQYKEYLIQEGFCSKKIEVVGSINGDTVWSAVQENEEVRESFREPRRVQEEMVRVLLSMPPNYHVTRGQFTCFPDSYEKLVEGILHDMKSMLNVDLTISVHPSTVAEDLKCFEALGVKVVKGGVIELIPQHDIYITDYSSTIRWAIACGKPVINYDFYNFNLEVYSEAKGVITVRKHLDYKHALLRLVNDDSFFADVSGEQIAVADRWGVIDGMFINNLAKIVERYSVSNKTLFDRVISLLSHKLFMRYKNALWLRYQSIFGNFD